MCDIHLCDNLIRRIFQAGPLSLLFLQEEKLDHLFRCEECAEKLAKLIASRAQQATLESVPPASDKVM